MDRLLRAAFGLPRRRTAKENRAVETGDEDPDELPATDPLRLRPVSTAEYFEVRAAASPMAMLKNPMVLMVLMTVLMAWGMPKMIENMDPEELKMMQERMGSQPTMQDILSGKATADAAKPKTGAERRAEQRAT